MRRHVDGRARNARRMVLRGATSAIADGVPIARVRALQAGADMRDGPRVAVGGAKFECLLRSDTREAVGVRL